MHLGTNSADGCSSEVNSDTTNLHVY